MAWSTAAAIPLPTLRRPSLVARLAPLGKMLRPTPHVRLAVEGMDLFAKREFLNPIGSIKDRSAYWILKRAAERGDIDEDTTVVESSSGNFATALAAYTRLLGLQFIPVIDPNISSTYESVLRRLCPRVVKVDRRDDTVPHAWWTNQYGNPDAAEAHYELTAGEICAGFESLDYAFIGVSTAGTI